MISTLVLAAVMSQAPQELRWEPRADLPITAVLVTGWVLSELVFKDQLAPAQCRWCATNGFDTAVRVAFNPTLSPSAEGIMPAHWVSNAIGFFGVPIIMAGVDALLSWRSGVFMEAFWVDLLLITESTFTALDLNQATKFLVGRARPYTIGASEELLAQGHDLPDNDLSFFSGHTTFTFALTASTATIAAMRNYKNAWVVWAVGLPLATTTAILRLAADKHWASDILIGAAVGTTIGILMPTLLHGRVGPIEARVTPMANGLAVSGRF